jgi:hypothetical protein
MTRFDHRAVQAEYLRRSGFRQRLLFVAALRRMDYDAARRQEQEIVNMVKSVDDAIIYERDRYGFLVGKLRWQRLQAMLGIKPITQEEIVRRASELVLDDF